MCGLQQHQKYTIATGPVIMFAVSCHLAYVYYTYAFHYCSQPNC